MEPHLWNSHFFSCPVCIWRPCCVETSPSYSTSESESPRVVCLTICLAVLIQLRLVTDICMNILQYMQPGIERIQALADVSRSALCCHKNETRALTANPPNSADLEGTPHHFPSYIRVRAVVWECGVCHIQTLCVYTDTQTAVTTIHFTSATPHAKCNKSLFAQLSEMDFEWIHLHVKQH